MQLFELTTAGRHDEALALQRQLVPVARLLGATHGVAGLKAALNLLGYDVGAAAAAAAAGVPRPIVRHAARGARRISRKSPHEPAARHRSHPARPGPEPDRAARDARDGVADAQPSRSADAARCSTTCARGSARLFRAPRRLVRVRRVGHRARRGWKPPSRTSSKTGTRALVVVTGYFGDRLAQMCERYGAAVTRLDVEWGRACDPDALRAQLQATPRRFVAMVHAETSTGVLNPVRELAADRARARRADDRRRGHLARRACRSTSAAWGIDAVLQLHAEVPRRAVRAGAGRVRAARARAARQVPQLLLRSRAARGLLAAAQVPPHDVVDARLRAGRGAADRRGRRARRALGAPRAATIARWSAALDGAGLSLLPPKASGCGPRTRCACPRRRRSGGAQAPARRVQHRDRRRPRPAGRQDLARRPDGRELVPAADRAPARRARKRARDSRDARCTCRGRPTRRRRRKPTQVESGTSSRGRLVRRAFIAAPAIAFAAACVRRTSRCPTCAAENSQPVDHRVHRAARARGAGERAEAAARAAVGRYNRISPD